MKTGTVIAAPLLAAALLTLAACGGGGGNPAPPMTGLAPTLDSIQANVFSVNCAISGCHGGAGAQQGLRLDPGFSAGNLINVASPRDANLIRVVPGDPDASFLIQKLDGTQTLGVRMPDGGPYLTTATINVIRQWIQDGAPQ
jgi:predicted small lipoprotein YifL